MLLRASTQNWKTILKRDFGIKPFRAKQLAMREVFSFSQHRPVLQYFDKKIACLKIAGIEDEDMQCSEIKDGLRDPEYRSVIKLNVEGNTVAQLRQDLIDNEDDCRVLWNKSQRLQQLAMSRPAPAVSAAFPATTVAPKPPIAPPRQPQTRVVEDRRGRGGIWRGPVRGSGRPPDAGHKEPLAITATASKFPPRPCRFCGGQHWDRECSYYKPAATAYHCYRLDISEEEFEKAEQDYNALQAEIFPSKDERDSNQDEDYRNSYDEPEVPMFKVTATSPTGLPPTKAPSMAEESDVHASGQIYHISEQYLVSRRPSPPSQSYPAMDVCRKCAQTFMSRNCLFAHLKQTNHYEKLKVENDPIASIAVVASTATTYGVGSGYSFRDYNYCEIKYVLLCDADGKPDHHKADYGCLDSGSGMSLIDEN